MENFHGFRGYNRQPRNLSREIFKIKLSSRTQFKCPTVSPTLQTATIYQSLRFSSFLHVVRHVAKHLVKERSSGKVNRFLRNMELSRGTKTLISHSFIDVVETYCYRPSVLVTIYKSSRLGHANSRAID